MSNPFTTPEYPADLAELIGLHRQLFAGWTMEADDAGSGAEGDEGDDSDDAEADESDTDAEDDEADDTEGAEQLGDAGKKALDSMKARLKAERTRRLEAERKAQAADAALAKAKGEDEATAQKRQAEADALAKANLRIAKAELRAAAAGKLADPADALAFIAVDEIEVGEDGEVDREQLDDLIADLVTKKPHLAAQAKPGSGNFDSGRGKTAKKAQLTREQLTALPPAERLQAVEDGRFKLT